MERNHRESFSRDYILRAANAKLVEQLRGISIQISQKTVDFESPLEKSLVLIKSLMANPSLSVEILEVLREISSCLMSSDLTSPDIERQLYKGTVQLDRDQQVSFSITLHLFLLIFFP